MIRMPASSRCFCSIRPRKRTLASAFVVPGSTCLPCLPSGRRQARRVDIWSLVFFSSFLFFSFFLLFAPTFRSLLHVHARGWTWGTSKGWGEEKKKRKEKKRRKEKKTKDQISTRNYRAHRKPITVYVNAAEPSRISVKTPATEPSLQGPPRLQTRLVEFLRYS